MKYLIINKIIATRMSTSLPSPTSKTKPMSLAELQKLATARFPPKKRKRTKKSPAGKKAKGRLF